jgi:hypothetical protein
VVEPAWATPPEKGKAKPDPGRDHRTLRPLPGSNQFEKENRWWRPLRGLTTGYGASIPLGSPSHVRFILKMAACFT